MSGQGAGFTTTQGATCHGRTTWTGPRWSFGHSPFSKAGAEALALSWPGAPKAPLMREYP